MEREIYAYTCVCVCVDVRNKRMGEDTFSSERVNWRSAIRWLASMRIRMVNILALAGGKIRLSDPS